MAKPPPLPSELGVPPDLAGFNGSLTSAAVLSSSSRDESAAVAPPPKVPQREVVPPILDDQQQASGWREWLPNRRELASGLLSAVFHTALFVVLGWSLAESGAGGRAGTSLQASFSETFSADDLLAQDEREMLMAVETTPLRPDAETPHVDVPQLQAELPSVTLPKHAFRPPAPPDMSQLQSSLPNGEATVATEKGGSHGIAGILDGRSLRLQGRLAGKGEGVGIQGATGPSEAAVEKALRWLAAHQLDTGGWNFDHSKGLCQGLCRHPGSVATTTGATGLALLPFLGAGYTHKQGEHREVVQRGLYYLLARGRRTEHGLDLQEGTMYAHGIATIALCEAYAMTKDVSLRLPAQEAVNFIVYAQDRHGGGWRYAPGMPGDTTVTGWQLMALKSGQMAQLSVPRPTIYLAEKFLTSTQYEGGARYRYLPDGGHATQTTTAVGLLCRVYTGWKRTNPGLRRGLATLSKWGPSEEDVYYNYYATQVLYHWGGRNWEVWNRKLRDYLVDTQSNAGHESGSWFFEGGRHSNAGGRLYVTAMNTLILEVYYRHLPLFDRRVFNDN